jgi:hypothetical protein
VRVTYNVVTPLEDQWVDTPAKVTDAIARYMETDNPVLAKVTVTRLKDTGETTGSGEVMTPQEFWHP